MYSPIRRNTSNNQIQSLSTESLRRFFSSFFLFFSLLSKFAIYLQAPLLGTHYLGAISFNNRRSCQTQRTTNRANIESTGFGCDKGYPVHKHIIMKHRFQVLLKEPAQNGFTQEVEEVRIQCHFI